MPGAYAHLTLVNLAADAATLRRSGFPEEVLGAIQGWFRFAELGALSPDLPYLDIVHPKAKAWADAMHYDRTDAVIRAAWAGLKGLDGDDREKAIAWLFGYVSHVVGDVTIHPVVELKVGTYAQNQKQHRVCEMNQDVHVFARLNIAAVDLADHLGSGVGLCGGPDGLDPAVRGLWAQALAAVHPGLDAPDPGAWHAGFCRIVETITAASGSRLVALARHVVPGDHGVVYPPAADRAFIDTLQTPAGTLSYDQVFDRAIANVQRVWRHLAAGLVAGDDAALAILEPWNLDTGRNPAGTLSLWS